MDALTTNNVEHARQRLLATERRLQHIVDHFCAHESPSSEGEALIMPFIQDIDEALREIRTAQSVLDSALLTAGFAATQHHCR